MLWQILGGFIFVFFALVLFRGWRFIVYDSQVNEWRRSRSLYIGGYSVFALVGLALAAAVTAVGLSMLIGTIP